MAKIYAALIRKGIKTLDEVPARLRSTVKALLAEAEKRTLQDEYFTHAEKAMDNLRTAKENAAALKTESAAKSCSFPGKYGILILTNKTQFGGSIRNDRTRENDKWRAIRSIRSGTGAITLECTQIGKKVQPDG